MTYHDLHRKLSDQPFKPFRLRLVNNQVYDIRAPWMAIPGRSSAVIATQSVEDEQGVRVATDWKTVSIQHMLEFSDLDEKSNGSRRKKR
jgi:hypothetical protein